MMEKLLALDSRIEAYPKADRPALKLPVLILGSILERLSREFGFDMLLAHTAIDRPAEGKIELVYQLCSGTNGSQLMLLVPLDRERPVAPTASAIWRIAEWQEREVFDLFGVLYENHPDLRRILLEDDWKGHPLRKDYRDDFLLERPW